MMILDYVLITALLLDILFVSYKVWKYSKRVSRLETIRETTKMSKSIFLSNSSESVDELIDILKKDCITIDFSLEG